MKRATYTADLVGITTLTFGRMLQSERLNGESADVHDKRCWKERCHALKDGRVIWPGIAFKLGLEQAAKMRMDKVPGKKSSTFTARFKTGVMVDPTAPPTVVYQLDGTKEDAVTIEGITGRSIYVPSDGRRGGTTRVPRIFPEVDPKWVIHLSLMIVDADLIEHSDVITRTLETAGLQIGIGCNRPGTSGGDHGIFLVETPMFEVVE